MDGMKPQKAFLIYFEDADREPIVIFDEEAARKTYDLMLDNWNCHFFEMTSFNGKPI